MAEEQGQERTEEATPKKREDARKKGQVARSKELSTMLVTLAGAISLVIFGPAMASAMKALMVFSFSPAAMVETPTAELPALFFQLLVSSLLSTWPLLLLCFVAAIVAATALGGITFSLSLKFERLDPIQGIGKLFSQQSAMELAKSVLKVVVIGAVVVVVLLMVTDTLLELGRRVPERAIADSAGMLVWFFVMVSLPLIVIALVDVPWQIFSHNRQLRMTRQEVRDELKQSDGNPELKAKIRQTQQAMSRRRMMQAVPEADVIITNPTHFSVALKYDQRRGGAPVLVAKGLDEVAFQIRDIARNHQVAIVASPKLARALYATTALDQEIPAALYLAVAQILTYVYQLRQWEAGEAQYPDLPRPAVDDALITGVAAMPPTA